MNEVKSLQTELRASPFFFKYDISVNVERV